MPVRTWGEGRSAPAGRVRETSPPPEPAVRRATTRRFSSASREGGRRWLPAHYGLVRCIKLPLYSVADRKGSRKEEKSRLP